MQKESMSGQRVRIVDFQVDGYPEEGYLSIMECGKTVPFDIARTFVTYDTPESVMRGGHAHYNTEMIMIAVKGSILLETEDRDGLKEQFTLDSPTMGVYLPVLCWHTMRYTEGSIQLVLASTRYDPGDYIFDYADFLKIRESRQHD